jgi:methanogenic corrinoid protein MtbC1
MSALENAPVKKKSSGSERDLVQLVSTIEGEIIPRLMLAHKTAPGFTLISTTADEPASTPDRDDIMALAGFVLAHDSTSALSYIDAMRDRGIALEIIYLDLLTPTARYLGELWVEDLCDFTEVTIGLCCLHQVLRELSLAFRTEDEAQSETSQTYNRRILLVPVPGEQHTFGLAMVAEFFRRAGWDVWTDPATTAERIIDMMHKEAFKILGLSVSGEIHLDQLTDLITAIRKHPDSNSVGILVGGQVFIEHPEMVTQIGADATGADGRQAVLQAENMLTLQAIR